MGFFNWVRKKAGLPVYDSESDPYTVWFTSKKDGTTEKKKIPVGTYILKVDTRDKRVFDIFGINGHKEITSQQIHEGDNGVLEVVVRAPTLDYLVIPNGMLNAEFCRRPGPNNTPEVKMKVLVIFPQNMPSTKFKWLYVLNRARQNKYADFQVMLQPVDEEFGNNVIKILPGNIPDGSPGAGAPKLRIVDGRGIGGGARNAIDNQEMRDILDVESGWIRNHLFNKGFMLSAVFTNEELEDVRFGRYRIIVKANFDNISQEIEIGHIDFMEGVEENIELSIEQLNPKETKSIPADGISFAEFKIKAKYLDDSKKKGKPSGLICHLETGTPLRITDTNGTPLQAGAAPGLGAPNPTPGRRVPPPQPGAPPRSGHLHRLRIDNGESPAFRIYSEPKLMNVHLTAEMLNANSAEADISFGKFKLERLESTDKVVAGLGMNLQVRVAVKDEATNNPIVVGLPPPKVKFVAEGDATLIIPGGSGLGSKELTVSVGSDGIAIVNVLPGERADTINIIASMGGQAKEITIPLKVIHPVIELLDQFGEQEKGFIYGKKYLITARVTAPKEDSNVNIKGVLVTFLTQREKTIGHFVQHDEYILLDNHGKPESDPEPNQVHVKVENGLAKVEYEVKSKDPREKFFILYATVAFSKNRAQLKIPISPGKNKKRKLSPEQKEEKEAEKEVEEDTKEIKKEDGEKDGSTSLLYFTEKEIKRLKRIKTGLITLRKDTEKAGSDVNLIHRIRLLEQIVTKIIQHAGKEGKIGKDKGLDIKEIQGISPDTNQKGTERPALNHAGLQIEGFDLRSMTHKQLTDNLDYVERLMKAYNIDPHLKP